jgi:hypothetical protein
VASGEIELAAAVRAGNGAVAEGRSTPAPPEMTAMDRFWARQRALRKGERDLR